MNNVSDGSSAEARRPWFVGALTLALTLAVFAPVARLGYVDWDDALHTYQNPHLNSLSGVEWLWRHPYGFLYVPLSYTVYALLAAIAHRSVLIPTPEGTGTPLDPRVFHLANLAVHLGNTLLVYLILRRLLGQGRPTNSAWPASIGALLFGIHPMQVESVAWISELRGLLCTGFSLLAIWQSIKVAQRDAPWRQSTWGYGGATLAFVLALLCKPSAVTVPLIVLALDHWVVGRSWRRCGPPMLAWLAVSGAWVVLTRTAQPLEYTPLAVWTRPLVAGDALWFYLVHLLWPARLGPDYGRTPLWAVRHGAWAETGALLLLAALLWRGRRRTPLLAAAAIFAAVLLPVLGLVPFAFQLYSTVADRYISLALLGPALAVGWLLTQCEPLPRLRAPAMTVSLAILVACGWRSVVQIPTWGDALAFTANALRVNPHSWVMHYNRGHYWELQGDNVDAAAEYRLAIASNPNMAEAYSNLGNVLVHLGHFAQADSEFQTAMRLDPTLPQPHVALGNSLAMQGNAAGAATQWRAAIRFWPNVSVLRYNLGMALLHQGQTLAAIAQFHQALRCQPDYTPAQVALAQATRPAVQ